jgi:hypothetical protein
MAIPGLLAVLRTALIECEEALIGELAGTLLAITPDVKRHVREHFNERDPELRRLALDALKEQKIRARQAQSPADASTGGKKGPQKLPEPPVGRGQG